MPSVGTVISYPIPPYQNVPIEPQYYQPSRFVIYSVTLGQETIITTSVNHNYVIGQLVRLIIPAAFGCFQLNESKGYVLSIPSSNQVLVSIDSSVNVDHFIASSSTAVFPQILAIGDVNSGQTNANGINSTLTYIPGSFINISPL